MNPSIAETKDGTVWIGGHENFNSLYAFRNGVWTFYKTSDIPVPGNYIIDLLEASELRQALGQLDAGFGRLTLNLDRLSISFTQLQTA